MKPTGFYYDPIFQEHLKGIQHPENPQRLEAVLRAFQSVQNSRGPERIKAFNTQDILLEELQRVHPESYIQKVQQEIELGYPTLSTGDTHVTPSSYQVALRASGTALRAIDDLLQHQQTSNAFCALRPPGHHARNEQGMGFCIFNHIALAARHAQQQHGLGKVLIVDWDVHHGNGTQDIFYEDDSVLFFSTHQWPYYPGTGDRSETGSGRGLGYTLNCPQAFGTTGTELIKAYTDLLEPKVQQFKPELILISCGFDSRKDDPLGGFQLEDCDFEILTRLMQTWSKTFSAPIVSFLEGGYALEGLELACTSHLLALTEA